MMSLKGIIKIPVVIGIILAIHSCNKPENNEIIDGDGNVYNSIKIGAQEWLAENLKTTRYSNGDLIGTTPATKIISGETSPKYQWAYQGDEASVLKYGRLYTWFAAVDSRNICPDGWHVPSKTEWSILTTFLGGDDVAGGKLKGSDTTYWHCDYGNIGATNESGFNALPGGRRLEYHGEFFVDRGSIAGYWLSTEATNPFAPYLQCGSNSVYLFGTDKKTGYSVRCLRDGPVQVTLAAVTSDTIYPTSITYTGAVAEGQVLGDGGSAVSDRGFCWSSLHTPTISDSLTRNGTGIGPFQSFLTGLRPNRTYKLRAYATNSAGTAYGRIMSFNTLLYPFGGILFNPNLTYGSLTDIEGNNYKTIQIGTQRWMAENLKTTIYNDGSSIPIGSNVSTPSYCWYKNDPSTYKTCFGALYNWYAVNTGKLCPTGWHVPTIDEWTTLETYLGGDDIAGGKLKETGTTHWLNPNIGATNESGFTALPGGCIGNYGYVNIWGYGYWWSSTENSSAYAHSQVIFFNLNSIHHAVFNEKKLGFSIRCVKDN